MLFAQGSRFGGHALYIKDNRLHYVNSFVGSVEQTVVGSKDVPTGKNLILSASFEKDGQEPTGRPGRSRSSTVRRRSVKAGSTRSWARSRSPARASSSAGTRASRDHRRLPRRVAARFTGGTINRLAIDVSGEPYLDLEREAALMLMRGIAGAAQSRLTVAQSFLHAHDRPAVLAGALERLLGAGGVVELPLGVVVEHEQPQGRLVRRGS